jgi:hypothetical protein
VHGLFYEIQRPHVPAPGGGSANATFYLPERFARRRPKALSEGPKSKGSGSMRLLEPDLRMYEGEVRGLFVEVTNDSGLDWPGGMEEPLVRLSYRWRHEPVERERTPLPAPLAQGESAIMPVAVIAPAHRGRYRLQLDLVHEQVRWLEAGIDAKVDVVARGETQRNIPGRLGRLLGRREFPACCTGSGLDPPDAGGGGRFGELRATIRTGSIAFGGTTISGARRAGGGRRAG